jgi:isopentenyldiphosphate isomerase
MQEQWQLYSEQGQVLSGAGAVKDDVFGKGLLHGAAHVWIWRDKNGVIDVLLQKRAATKRTWPNLYDIPAAGHIDLGEDPLKTAARETKEEIGVDINTDDLKLISVYRTHLLAPSGAIENEFQWIYLLKISGDIEFNLDEEEVSALDWKSLGDFKAGVSGDEADSQYLPHGSVYYNTVITAIEDQNSN